MNYLPFLVSNPDVMSGKTLNPVNYFCLPRFHQSFASLSSKKITPFTLERGNKDDGCFLEFIFAVSINIPLIAHHSWRGAWWSQLLLTENIWLFFFLPSLLYSRNYFYLNSTLLWSGKICIFVIINTGPCHAGTGNELLLKKPSILGPFTRGTMMAWDVYLAHFIFPYTPR